MKRNTQVKAKKESKKQSKEIHLYDDIYLSADKYQYIIFEKGIQEKGKNIGQEVEKNPKYFPSLELVFKYLFNISFKDYLSNDQIKTFEDMEVKYNQLLDELKEMKKGVKLEKK